MAQPVEATTILNARPFWMPLEAKTVQTDKRTDGRYQTYYLPCFAVNKNAYSRCESVDGQADRQTDGCYQMYYLPAMHCSVVDNDM